MRQLVSRVLDLVLGVSTAVLLVSAGGGASDVASAKAPTSVPVEAAYSAEVVELAPASPPADAKASQLAALVARGRHWRLDTANGPVHVWVPGGYDPATAQTVLYVHGYWQDADTVWREHRLPEQFALSGVNAMFVVPEAPRGKTDPVAWPSVRSLLSVVAALGEPMPKGRLAAMGHSGAYRTVIQWLADPRVDTVVLLDAAYVDVRPYREWVRGAKTRRFLNVSADTIRWSDRLHRSLPSTVTISPFPRELTDVMRAARVLYVKSEIRHWPLVTDGVAIPQMVRALGAPFLVDEPPSLGLPVLETSAPATGAALAAGDTMP